MNRRGLIGGFLAVFGSLVGVKAATPTPEKKLYDECPKHPNKKEEPPTFFVQSEIGANRFSFYWNNKEQHAFCLQCIAEKLSSSNDITEFKINNSARNI